ncbi:MAG: lambda exonuclease family protein [Bacilli bacterium]
MTDLKVYSDIIQGSDAWFDVKRGKVSASNFADVLAKGQGKTRRAYMLRLVAERLTGQTEPTYTNQFMEDGKEREDEARAYYEGVNDCQVEQVGFIELNEDIGCSPDGLIGEEGGLEIKCPKSTTHIEYILQGVLPSEYRPQVQGNLWVTGRKWWDFVSYDPRVINSPYFCVRVGRDEDCIKNIESEVNRFIEDMQKMIKEIKERTF